MSKILITVGLILVAIGVLWPLLQHLPLGRLPGDIVVERENFRFYFPVTTMILISGLITLILWLLNR